MNEYNSESDEKNNNLNQDEIICNLKSQIFEKVQNKKNFLLLQSKFRNLQKELQSLIQAKHRLENEIQSKSDSGNKSLSSLKEKNDNLLNELKDQKENIQKLNDENKNLFNNLENKKIEFKGLKEHLHEQEGTLSKLNDEKSKLEKEIMELNKVNETDINDIQNLNNQINNLNKKSNEQNIIFNQKNFQNQEILKNLKTQEFDNNNLFGKLKVKENALMKAQQQLENANKYLNKLQNDYNVLNTEYQKQRSKHIDVHNRIDRENLLISEIGGNNKKLEDIVNERKEIIDKLEKENKIFKTDLDKLVKEKIFLGHKVEGYKRHILILTEQNDKLSKELENIPDRDMNILMELRRNEKIKCVEEQNGHIIGNSFDNLKIFYNQNMDVINSNNNINELQNESIKNENSNEYINHNNNNINNNNNVDNDNINNINNNNQKNNNYTENNNI